jgi:membrane protein required for colicin V production
MNIVAFDIVSIIILLIIAIRATFRGFVAEIMSMASIIVGIAIAVIFTHPVSVILQGYIGESFWNTIIAFLGLFLISYLLIKIFENSLNTLIEKVQLEKLDQALGFFLGLIEGFLLIVILVFLLKAQPVFSVEHLMENSFAASIADKIIPLGTRIIEEGIQA